MYTPYSKNRGLHQHSRVKKYNFVMKTYLKLAAPRDCQTSRSKRVNFFVVLLTSFRTSYNFTFVPIPLSDCKLLKQKRTYFRDTGSIYLFLNWKKISPHGASEQLFWCLAVTVPLWTSFGIFLCSEWFWNSIVCLMLSRLRRFLRPPQETRLQSFLYD